LGQILSLFNIGKNNPNILVDSSDKDDAAVYKINDNQCIVMTIDFFPPNVDSPYSYGEIAASNSMSDIYAMGVDPIIGLNIAAFPKTFPKEIIKQILNGSKSKCDEAGLNIVGGHTIYDSEPKYGIAAIGITECKNIITNSNANEEEAIILTKPLGTGIINNLLMNEKLESNNAIVIDAIESMSMLNKYAKDIMLKYNASSCVDITGYGLIGHIYTLALNSRISCTLYPNSLPIINNIEKYIESNISSGTKSNMEFANLKIKDFQNLNNKEKIILSDAQTSGGLLFTVNKSDAISVINDLIKTDHQQATIIGETNKLENNEFIRFG
tara:strand:+ start:8568 stop:9545 length:978 start_codon:yes stop_codon:yes gene_type:complete